MESDRGPGKNSIFEKNDQLKPFTIPKPLGDKAFEVVGIPLQEPGFYVVELASPRLGAACSAKNRVTDQATSLVTNLLSSGKLSNTRPYYVHAAALVTNLSVHFKQGRESSLVWVTSLDKGKPVAAADVAVRDCTGKIYVQGKTDAQGLLQIKQELPDLNILPGCMSKYDHQYFVTARLGKDFSFVLSNWNEGIALWRFNALETALERPRSRPRDHGSHAAARRRNRAHETDRAPQDRRRFRQPARPRCRSPSPSSIRAAKTSSSLPVSWDSRGTATLDWTVPQDAKQGTYVVQMPQAAGSFQVESFRVPTMKAILQSADKALVNAEQAALNIQVNYLAGGGASFLPVKLRGQIAQKVIVSFADYEDFTFANGGVKLGVQKNTREPWNYGDYEMTDPDEEGAAPAPRQRRPGSIALTTQELRLDAAGAGHAIFTKLHKAEAPQDIQAELEYQDPNGETLTAASAHSRYGRRK